MSQAFPSLTPLFIFIFKKILIIYLLFIFDLFLFLLGYSIY